jgi:DNA-binding transcriptional LysR family regulator
MVPVASPRHALAAVKGRIHAKHFIQAIQIVLSERADTGVADQGVLSPRTWRVGDLHTKRELLRAGLGWGNLPEHLARDDLRAKKLVVLVGSRKAIGQAVRTVSAGRRCTALDFRLRS